MKLQAAAGVALVLAVVFAVQNDDRVRMEFLFFDVTARLWVGFLVSLVLGAVLGQAVEAVRDRRRKRK